MIIMVSFVVLLIRSHDCEFILVVEVDGGARDIIITNDINHSPPVFQANDVGLSDESRP